VFEIVAVVEVVVDGLAVLGSAAANLSTTPQM
jgi:hypothetical protein